jgi:Pvc16 N-terminal domain
MSNFLAIAAATATLSQLLQDTMDVPGGTVTTLRPDGIGQRPGKSINVYLYQVTPNPAWRNSDLPSRSGDGSIVQRPRAALDLHYLLSFYGNDTELEPQRLMGSAVRTLHSYPVLGREMIRSVVNSASFTFLADSDLAEDIELVRFTPSALSLEELSKLWNVFFQTQYALSIAYQGTVVMIEANETPKAVLPVRARNVYVTPFHQPIVEQVVARPDPSQPIVAGSKIAILGQQLRSDLTTILIQGAEVTPAAGDVTDTQVVVTLPETLNAGVQSLQIVQPLLIGTPPVPHRGVESNVAPFVLSPKIVGLIVAPGQITVKTDVQIGKAQRVVLLLNQMGNANPNTYSFSINSRNADSNSVTIPMSGVSAGDYLVRLQVDGAPSLLNVDTDPANPTFNQYIGPKVTIP